MSNEDLARMARTSNGGDKCRVLEQLYTQNSGLIHKAVRRFNGLLEADDAKQECYLCLEFAVDRYDETAGKTFASFWYMCMVQHLFKCIGSTTAAAIPENMRHKIGKLRRARADLVQILGSEPDMEQLSWYMDISTEEVEQIRKYSGALSAASLDAPLSETDEGDALTIGDTLSTGIDEAEGVEDRIQQEELAAVIWAEVDALKPAQAAVVRGRYQNGETLEEVGRRQGVSASRAQTIEHEALRCLRYGRARDRLMPFLSDVAVAISYRGKMQHIYNETASPTEAAVLYDLGDMSYIDYVMRKYGGND